MDGIILIYKIRQTKFSLITYITPTLAAKCAFSSWYTWVPNLWSLFCAEKCRTADGTYESHDIVNMTGNRESSICWFFDVLKKEGFEKPNTTLTRFKQRHNDTCGKCSELSYGIASRWRYCLNFEICELRDALTTNSPWSSNCRHNWGSNCQSCLEKTLKRVTHKASSCTSAQEQSERVVGCWHGMNSDATKTSIIACSEGI